MIVGDHERGVFPQALPPPDVRVDCSPLDRPRPHDRDLDDEVVEVLRPRTANRLHLRAALDLEDADGVGRADRLEGLRVVERDARQVDSLTAHARDFLDAALDRREHPQAEQVDLQEARVSARVLVPLDHLPALHRRGHHRAAVDQRSRRDHHPARVLGEMAWQPVRLLDQLRQPAPARRARARGGDGLRVSAPGLSAPSCALDLTGGQPEDLAQLANRPARAERRKGRHQRCTIAPVALVHARDQPLADVTGKVQVDVGQPVQILVQEAPQLQPARDRIDVRETDQVAHDRGDRRSPPTSGRQQRARRVAAGPDLRGDLAGQLEHVVVEQEEARQAELLDHAQLLFQARVRLRVGASRACRRGHAIRPVALVQTCPAQLCQTARRTLVLRPRIAVAEVRGQVEPQLLGQRQRLTDSLGMIVEAAGHRPGRAHHVAVVAASQRLACVERGVVGERHERVLQLGPGARVRMDVAGGHAPDSQSPCLRRQCAVARTVVAGVRALQLHVQAIPPERVQQPSRNGLVVAAASDHRALGAARQADQALGVVDHRLHVNPRLAALAPRRAVTGVRVGERDDPAEVAPAARVAHEQRQVTSRVRPVRTVRHTAAITILAGARRAESDVDLRAVDRPHPAVRCDLRQLHRSRERVVVGQRQRRVAQLARALHQLVRQRDAVQERVRRVAVQLDVWSRSAHCSEPAA